MRVSDAFPSKYLKAEDLGQHKPTLTIASVTMETIGDDTRPVVMFVGQAKSLVLNKTNASVLVDAFGTDEMDDWRGQRLRLYATRVPYQGKMVPALRVEAAPAPAQAVQAQQAQQAQQAPTVMGRPRAVAPPAPPAWVETDDDFPGDAVSQMVTNDDGAPVF